MTNRVERKSNAMKNSKAKSQTAKIGSAHLRRVQKEEWSLSAIKMAFYYRLFMITLLCVVSGILALGEFPLELRISGAAALHGLARFLVRSLDGLSFAR
jgi:hypothetical protein